MKRHTQTLLFHLLPVLFGLLAIAGAVSALLFIPAIDRSTCGIIAYFLPSLFVLLCLIIIASLKRHNSSVEPSFIMAILIGIASYWLPTIVIILLPFALYMYSHRFFEARSIGAILIGLALVAIWASVAIYLGWITNPWAHFLDIENAWGWIPTGALLLAWIAITIVRRTLRVR